MPAIKKVKTLLQISSSTISSSLLEIFHKKGVEDVPGWSESLYQLLTAHVQSGVYEDIVHILLRQLDHDLLNNPEIKSRVRQFVPSLFGQHNKSLDFTSYRVLADKIVMKTIYEKFERSSPNIEKLCLGQSFFFLPDLVAGLNSKLTGMNKLVSLKLLYIATDSMLIDIGKFCPKLVELNLKGSNGIEDSSAPSISGCKNLMILDIQGTKISGKGCHQILENCPKLEWIEHCPFNCDSDFQIFKSRKEMFELIQKGYLELQLNALSRNEKPDNQEDKVYGIKNFWLFNPKTEELLVSHICPKIERLILDFVFQDMDYSLEPTPIGNFKYLDTLDLNFYDKHQNLLLDRILSVCGKSLTTMIYNVCADYRSVVDGHNIIARHCPNLISLKFIGDYCNPAHLDQETDSILKIRSSEFQPHPKLRHLTLGGYCTDGRLAWLLSGAPNITQIELDGNLEQLSDSAWFAIHMDNPLKKLESLWLNTSTNMTMKSVNLLLDHCPNLRKVGRLIHLREHSGGARRDNLIQLENRAKDESWDVDFIWVTPNVRSKAMSPIRTF